MTEASSARRPRDSSSAGAGHLAPVLALGAAGWAITVDRMEDMGTGAGMGLGGLGWFTVTWLTMMAAMMLPSAAPRVLDCARLGGGTGALPALRRAGATVLFTVGYLLAWLLAGVVAYVLVEGIRSLGGGWATAPEAGRYVSAGVVTLAAGYQLTAAKRACLRRCRRSLPDAVGGRGAFLGALRMGVGHGVVCIGCCWAMMAALVALGLMSILWMALVAALIAAEKLLPWRRAASRGTAIALAALAIAVAVGPQRVPGLPPIAPPGGGEVMPYMGADGDGGGPAAPKP